MQFNVLWLNPMHPDTFPEGFIDALDDPALVQALQRHRPHDLLEGNLRARMQADALQPLSSLEDDEEAVTSKPAPSKTPYSEEDIKEAEQFLRLAVSLELTLLYTRIT